MEKVGEDFYSQAIVQIGELKNEETELNEMLELYESILIAQKQVTKSFDPDLSIFDAEYCRSRSSGGIPLLTGGVIEIDQHMLERSLEAMCRIISEKNGEAIPQNFEVSSLSEQRKLLVKGLVDDGLALESLASEAGIEYEVFSFLVFRK